MKIGFLFPGQGAQSVGMGKDLYENFDEVKEIYEKVQNITGVDVAKITFNEDDNEDCNEDEVAASEVLNQTKNTQLAILTMSLGILKLLEKNNVKADISSGLSLGEYSALVYSKMLSFEDGVSIVKNRGEYMQNLVPDGKWSMAAVLGMEEDQIVEVCSKVTKGFAVPVNFNCPGQIVVSGDEEGILEAETLAKEAGAKKVRVLNTSGPFHTEKLVDAAKALRKDLDKITFNSQETKVAKNLDGSIYSSNDNMPEILEKHIISPVKFTNCLQTMLDEGVDTFIEIGPGKTLSGFVKRMPTEKEINILNICDKASLEKVLDFVKENG